MENPHSAEEAPYNSKGNQLDFNEKHKNSVVDDSDYKDNVISPSLDHSPKDLEDFSCINARIQALKGSLELTDSTNSHSQTSSFVTSIESAFSAGIMILYYISKFKFIIILYLYWVIPYDVSLIESALNSEAPPLSSASSSSSSSLIEGVDTGITSSSFASFKASSYDVPLSTQLSSHIVDFSTSHLEAKTTPLIQKRGPGRPRKDGTIPVQRKKVPS